MATIGTFTKNDNRAGFTGAVKTLPSTSRPSSSPPRAKGSTAPIYASLVEGEDGEGHNLIWSRRDGD